MTVVWGARAANAAAEREGGEEGPCEFHFDYVWFVLLMVGGCVLSVFVCV